MVREQRHGFLGGLELLLKQKMDYFLATLFPAA